MVKNVSKKRKKKKSKTACTGEMSDIIKYMVNKHIDRFEEEC